MQLTKHCFMPAVLLLLYSWDSGFTSPSSWCFPKKYMVDVNPPRVISINRGGSLQYRSHIPRPGKKESMPCNEDHDPNLNKCHTEIMAFQDVGVSSLETGGEKQGKGSFDDLLYPLCPPPPPNPTHPPNVDEVSVKGREARR